MKADDFDVLMGKYLDGLASSDDKRRLLERLEVSPELRIRLAQQLFHEKSLAHAFSAGRLAASGDAGTSVSGHRVWRWLAPTSLAASLLLAMGIAAWMNRPLEPVLFATVAGVEGPAISRGAGGERSLTARTAIQSGDTLATASGARLSLQLAAGGSLVMDQNSELRVSDVGAGSALVLKHGNLYFDVSPVRPAGARLTVAVADGPSVSVVGTRFETGAAGGVLSLKVEEGKVRLHLPSGDTDVGALQQVAAGAARILSGPDPVRLSEIARWAFRQDRVRPGTVVFVEDFEKGLDHWDVISGDWSLAPGRGFENSQGLAVARQGREEAERPPAISPRFQPRHRDYEISWLMSLPESFGSINYGPLFFASEQASSRVDTPLIESFPLSLQAGAGRGRGIKIRAVIHGDRCDLYTNNRKSHSMRIAAPYSRVALRAQQVGGGEDLVLDNVRIFVLPPEPGVAGKGRVLFSDDFEGDLSRWALPDAGAELATGLGVSGSRCLRLSCETDEKDPNVTVFPRLPNYPADFEAVFDGFIEHPARQKPAVGVGFTLKFPPGVDLPRLEAPGAIELPRNTWLAFRAVFHGGEYSFEIHQGTNRIARQAFPLQAPGVVPGVNLNTRDSRCRMRIDNFRIRSLGD